MVMLYSRVLMWVNNLVMRQIKTVLSKWEMKLGGEEYYDGGGEEEVGFKVLEKTNSG